MSNANACSSQDHQRAIWDALEKEIYELVDNATISNIETTVAELSKLDMIRGKGIFCEACIARQKIDVQNTALVAALVAAVNKNHPDVGLLLCKRVVWFFDTVLRKNIKRLLVSTGKFVACLVNLNVLEVFVVINMMKKMLKNPIDGSFEVLVHFLEECQWNFKNCLPGFVKLVCEHLMKALNVKYIEAEEKIIIRGFFTNRSTGVRRITLAEILGVVDVSEQVNHSVDLGTEPIDIEIELNDFQTHPLFREGDRYDEVKEVRTDLDIEDLEYRILSFYDWID